MNMPMPWSRRAPAEPEPTGNEIDIDIREPRECIHEQFEGSPGPCPRCGEPLHASYQTYVVSTRHGQAAADSFLMGGDMGWFCLRCPTVVINWNELEEMLGQSLPHESVGHEATVLGIVDMDAIPKEKRHLEMGTDENPIPLVRFRNYSSRLERRWTAAQIKKANVRTQAALSRKKNRPKKKR
jgi:hypothetical protein